MPALGSVVKATRVEYLEGGSWLMSFNHDNHGHHGVIAACDLPADSTDQNDVIRCRLLEMKNGMCILKPIKTKPYHPA
jgi:hypothetical protein